MSEEEAKNILANCIADYVLGDYCIQSCDEEENCKNEDCVFQHAIDTVLKALEKKDYLIHTMEAEFNRLEDLEEFRTEHKIMKRIIVENNLWETLLNDDEFIEHLEE